MESLRNRQSILLGLFLVIIVIIVFIFTVVANQYQEVKVINPNADIETYCESKGGNWIETSKECEGITQLECESKNGTYNECASACRNNPSAEMCTLQCVLVCEF